MNRWHSGHISQRLQLVQRRLLLALALVLGCVLFAPAAARAAGPNCTVNGAGGANYTTIQAAVNDTGCTTITVAAGTYQEHVTIGRDVTISGAGASSTTVDGTHTGTVFSITSGTVTLHNLTITNGSGTTGGILNQGTLTVSNSTLTSNSAIDSSYDVGRGGGILNQGTLTVSNSTVSGNSTPYFGFGGGGGIYNENGNSLTVSNSTISGNIGGGGIYNNGSTLTVSNSTISGNTGSGGIYNNYNATATVSNSIISGNNGSGGIFNLGALTVNNSTLSENTGGFGGGIYNNYNATATVSNSTLSGNTSVYGGGIGNTGTLTVSNSTLAGNSAIESSYDIGRGGGIYNSGNVTVSNSSLSGNSASLGGGIANHYDYVTATVSNSIIANSLSGGDCSLDAPITDIGGNLADDASCNFTAASSRSSTDPKLDPAGLKDNGGPTKTIALLSGSPAIDAAVSCPPPASDQRGIARPQGSGCDSGAFELEQQAAFAWSGFFAPVDNPPTLNQAKAGAAIPVKFSLGGDFGLTIFASGYPKFQTTQCSSNDPIDPVETTVSAGQSGLSYDAATGQYTYVWKTNKQWAGKCGTLTLSFTDGSQHTANFKFTK